MPLTQFILLLLVSVRADAELKNEDTVIFLANCKVRVASQPLSIAK
jgi:hypothetical protein